MIPLVNLKKQYQSIKPEIDQAIAGVLESAAFINGPRLKQFEKDFAHRCGASYGVGTSSGTTAIYLALKALDIGPGDEVITVPNTFIATTEAISQTQARVRFVDIDERTFNIDTQRLEAVINERTKAIVPVHLYGQPCDVSSVMEIARKYRLEVIYDAAQAHLAEFEGKPLGLFGAAVCYSFYPGKNLGAYGDAGMVITNDGNLAQKIRMLSNHGRVNKYEHVVEGYNYRMDELQAAVLNVKLKYLPEWTKKRQKIAKIYNSFFMDSSVQAPWVGERLNHVYHLYVVRVKNRDKVKEAMAQEGLSSGIHYPIPLHLQKAYQYLDHCEGSFPVAEQAAREILSLPLFPELSQSEAQRVVSVLKRVCEQKAQKVIEHV